MRVMLASRHLECFFAETAQQALDYCKEFTPSLILLDIALPDMDGFVLAAILRDKEETKMTPILAVTAYGYAEIKNRIKEVGCQGTITKPFTIKELFDAIEPYI